MNKRNDFSLISRYRTSIMGFAALWIYIYHEWQKIFLSGGFLSGAEDFIKKIGFGGVDFFFLLSGMGLVYAIEKYNLLTFQKRRMERVLIPFVLTAAAMAPALGWSAIEFAKKVLGYNFLFENIYSFLWFVPAIVILYLLFPVYHWLFQKAPSKTQFTLAALLVWLVLAMGLEGILRNDLYGFFNRVPVFLIGVLIGWSIREQEVVFTKLTWLIWVLVLGLGLYFAYRTNYHGLYLVVPYSNCCIPNLLIALSGSCLLAKVFSWLDSVKIGKWILKLFGLFGTISLEFYCVQEWIGNEVRTHLPGRCGNRAINTATFLGVLAAALALYGLCQGIRWVLGKIGRKKVKSEL